MINKAIYPGTFDPFTNGHLDLTTRAAKIFDQIILAVSTNKNKKPLFNLEDRVSWASIATKHLSNVTVIGFDDLTAIFAKKQKINILIRGLRVMSDFECEMQLAKINRHIMPNLESIFMIPTDTCSYISSSLIKDMILYGGNIHHFLPTVIAKAITSRLQQ